MVKGKEREGTDMEAGEEMAGWAKGRGMVGEGRTRFRGRRSEGIGERATGRSERKESKGRRTSFAYVPDLGLGAVRSGMYCSVIFACSAWIVDHGALLSYGLISRFRDSCQCVCGIRQPNTAWA